MRTNVGVLINSAENLTIHGYPVSFLIVDSTVSLLPFLCLKRTNNLEILESIFLEQNFKFIRLSLHPSCSSNRATAGQITTPLI